MYSVIVMYNIFCNRQMYSSVVTTFVVSPAVVSTAEIKLALAGLGDIIRVQGVRRRQ